MIEAKNNMMETKYLSEIELIKAKCLSKAETIELIESKIESAKARDSNEARPRQPGPGRPRQSRQPGPARPRPRLRQSGKLIGRGQGRNRNNNFVPFLVQMRPRKFAFEIN